MTALIIKPCLIPPYGGELVNLLACGDERLELLEMSQHLPGIPLSPRSLCDLELLATGAFSPLDRFMGRSDYERALTEMRLKDGVLFPIPVTLPVDQTALPKGCESITLTDAHHRALAILHIDEVFPYNPQREARLVLGTTDLCHPLIQEMLVWGQVYLSGEMQVIDLPHHVDHPELRQTPAQVRQRLERMGNANVIAFQTRNPMHRIHEELTKRAAQAVNGSLLLHPVVGLTKPGDVDYLTRIQIYRVLMEKYYNPGCTLLSLLPLAMRLAGPREALWHAIIRRNYGATHFIVGRDHAGPGKDCRGESFYGPYEAQLLVEQYSQEIGVHPVEFKELVYLADEDRYEEVDRVREGQRVFSISGTQVRQEYLAKGKPLPEWFTRPEVAEILQGAYSPVPH